MIELKRKQEDCIYVFIDAASVKQALVDVAMERVKGLYGAVDGDLKLEIKQETQGSPSYLVDRWKAVITIKRIAEE